MKKTIVKLKDKFVNFVKRIKKEKIRKLNML